MSGGCGCCDYFDDDSSGLHLLLSMARAFPGSIEPVIPTAEAAEAARASLRDLACFRASHGLRQASLSLDLDG